MRATTSLPVNQIPPLVYEHLPRELLTRLHADIATLLGATTVTFRADGSAWTDLFAVSPYCRQVASVPAGQARCIQSRRDLAMEAIDTGQTQQAHCHAGICMVAVPLMLGGKPIAASVVSLSPHPDNRDSVFVTAQTLGIDPGLLVAASQRTPPLSPDRLAASIRLLENLHRLYGQYLSAALETDEARQHVAQATRRMKALYSTSRAVTSTLSLDQMVRILVEQMAITTGLDRCLLLMRQPGTQILAPTGAYGLTPQESQRFHAIDHLELGIRTEWWDRLENGRTVLLPIGWLRNTPAGAVISVPPERRAMLAPVISGGTLSAVAYLDGAHNADDLTQQEIELLLAIAGQAGIAIGNIVRFRQEQRVAQTLQESLRTPIPAEVGDYRIHWLYLPALAEAQVGGDFFDLIEIDESRVALLIGDVSGKGVEAAVHTGMMKYMVRGLVVDDPSPATLVSRVNRAVAMQGGMENSFITFFYALLDSQENRIYYTNAGHEPPLLYHNFLDEARELPPTGPAIGLLDEFDYECEDRSLGEGDSILLYTDGAVEARDAEGRFFGLDELKKRFVRSARRSVAEIIGTVHTDLRKYTGGGLQDDLALLVLKRISPGA